jgi:hypothetical protein
MTEMMSLPPPAPESRTYVLELEPPRRRGAPGQLELSATGAVIAFESALHTPLQLPLGTLQLGLVELGSGGDGRFPVLKRLTATQIVPRERGVEGWLWTKGGGSALTTLGDVQDPPNAALLFTRPLGAGAVACFEPDAAREIAARSPLGAAAIHGLLFSVTDAVEAETVFRRFGLLRPLTDREVPPTLRRSLPTDRPASAPQRGSADDARAASSVAPPGLG